MQHFICGIEKKKMHQKESRRAATDIEQMSNYS